MRTILWGLLALVAISLGVYSQSDRMTQTRGGKFEPSIVNRITSKGGVPLVEIVEAKCEATPKRLERYSCRVRNSSDREITALVVVWTIIWSSDSSEHSTDEYQSRDTLLLEGSGGIPPGEVTLFDSSGPTWTEGSESIKDVRVSIDYVEFADKSSLGPDRTGASQRIALTRLGVTTYKNWLLHVYREEGPDSVISKLMSDGPVELRSNSNTSETYQHFTRSGAQMYKHWLASVYRKNGFDTVIEKLSQGATKQSN